MGGGEPPNVAQDLLTLNFFISTCNSNGTGHPMFLFAKSHTLPPGTSEFSYLWALEWWWVGGSWEEVLSSVALQ